MKKLYGLTTEQFAAMERQQNGCCAICGEPETAIDARTKTVKRLAVDHDHSSGRVRGLLCKACNQALGMFRDDPHLMRRAISYLIEPLEPLDTSTEET